MVDLATPASIQCSTPQGIRPTHYLNSFRGEPAMSRFDWPFTPIHKSSQNFSNSRVRSSSWCYPAFNLLMDRSPGFGSSCDKLIRPIQTRFPYAYTYRLKLAWHMKSLTHYTKGTPSPRSVAPTACRLPISGSVSLPLSGCFSPFPHGTCSLSVVEEYLGLEGGPPMFRQDFTCPALLESVAN